MEPKENNRIDRLENILGSVVRAENISFVESIKRRIGLGMVSVEDEASVSITTSVRNSADTGSEDVAKVPDRKLKIRLSDGTTAYIGIYTS